MYEYNGKVIDVSDAETITVVLQVGFRITVQKTILLYGIEAPKVRNGEHESGRISRDKLRSLILYKNIIVKTYKHDTETYLGDIYIETPQGIICVNDWLVKENLAKYRSSKTT